MTLPKRKKKKNHTLGGKMEKVMGTSGDSEGNKNQNCFSIYLVSARVQNTVKAPTQVLSDDRDAGKRERERSLV